MKQMFKDFLPIDFKEMRSKSFIDSALKSNASDIERIESKGGFKHIDHCDFCGSEQRELYLEKNGIKVFTCKNCGLTYSSVHPNNFDDLYSAEEYLDQTIESYEKNSEFRKKRFGTERVDILKKYKKNGTVLDLGCGIGWFLEVAKNHYDVIGVEISDSLRKYMKDKKGINSYKSLDDVEDDSVDIITGFDLIEHVPSPSDMLIKIHKKLKPGGISLLFTPNVDSVGFSMLKEKNSLLCPPAHLYYFNKETLSNYAVKHGFEVIRVWTCGLDIGDLFALNLQQGQGQVAKFLDDNQNWLQHSIDKAEFGNHMRIILKK
tara:strand:- start:32 stop:985 length:954 start_codon:yes stop_codon:yes gene_type:complete